MNTTTRGAALILAAVLLSGCKPARDMWQVKCDSGFETPVSYGTSIIEGMISWRVHKNSPVKYRKMLGGETCTDIRIKNKRGEGS